MSRVHATAAPAGHLLVPPTVMGVIALIAAVALTLDGSGAKRSLGATTSMGPNAPSVVTLAEGTPITVELGTSLSTGASRAGDMFAANVVSPVMVRERVAIPAGSRVRGHIAGASGVLSEEPSSLDLVFDWLEIDGRPYSIHGDRESAERSSSWNAASIVGGVLRSASRGSVTSSLGTLDPSSSGWFETPHRTLGSGTRLVFRLDRRVRVIRTS